jgi:hypothetical protein
MAWGTNRRIELEMLHVLALTGCLEAIKNSLSYIDSSSDSRIYSIQLSTVTTSILYTL